MDFANPRGRFTEPYSSSNTFLYIPLQYSFKCHNALYIEPKSVHTESGGQLGTMDRKRKLPARASARVGVSKKRASTPPEPSPAPTPAPVVEEGLPNSLAAGKPLPTVGEPQPEDLPSSKFKSVAERYVVL